MKSSPYTYQTHISILTSSVDSTLIAQNVPGTFWKTSGKTKKSLQLKLSGG